MDHRWNQLPNVVDFGTFKRSNKGSWANLWVYKMPRPHDYVTFDKWELLEYKIRVLTTESGSWHTIEAGNVQELESIRLQLEAGINDYKTNRFTYKPGLFRRIRVDRWKDRDEEWAYLMQSKLLRMLHKRYNVFIGYVPA